MGSGYHPVFGYAGVGIELHADLDHLPPLQQKWEGIALLVYLFQRLAGRAADLELEDIRRVGHPHHHVHPAASYLDLRAHIEIKHGEDEV